MSENQLQSNAGAFNIWLLLCDDVLRSQMEGLLASPKEFLDDELSVRFFNDLVKLGRGLEDSSTGQGRYLPTLIILQDDSNSWGVSECYRFLPKIYEKLDVVKIWYIYPDFMLPEPLDYRPSAHQPPVTFITHQAFRSLLFSGGFKNSIKQAWEFLKRSLSNVKKVSVWVVDDEPGILDDIKSNIKHYGKNDRLEYIFELIQSREQYSQILQSVQDVAKAKPDLVFLDNDFYSKKIGFDELLPEILSVTQEIPIICMTGKGEPEDVASQKKALDTGCCDFFHKSEMSHPADFIYRILRKHLKV